MLLLRDDIFQLSGFRTGFRRKKMEETVKRRQTCFAECSAMLNVAPLEFTKKHTHSNTPLYTKTLCIKTRVKANARMTKRGRVRVYTRGWLEIYFWSYFRIA